MSNFESKLDSSTFSSDCDFQHQVQRLHSFTICCRWILISLLWLFIAPLSFWSLRHEIPLWFDYFTWTAIRYSLIYNRLPALGLGFCIGLTVTTLLWQTRNLIFGIPPQHLRRLEKQVVKFGNGFADPRNGLFSKSALLIIRQH